MGVILFTNLSNKLESDSGITGKGSLFSDSGITGKGGLFSDSGIAGNGTVSLTPDFGITGKGSLFSDSGITGKKNLKTQAIFGINARETLKSLAYSGIIGLESLSALSGITGKYAFSTFSGIKGSIPQILDGIPYIKAYLGNNFGSQKSLLELKKSVDRSELVSAIIVNYAYNFATEQYTRSVKVSCDNDTEKTLSLDIKWVNDKSVIETVIRRILSYYFRPVTKISFNLGRDFRHITAGNWLYIDQSNLKPVGYYFVTSSVFDVSTGVLSLNAEHINKFDSSNVTYEYFDSDGDKVTDSGLDIQYVNGYALFTITDVNDDPITGAEVMLDNDPALSGVTDSKGVARIQVPRGTYTVTVTATGYIPVEYEITI